MTRYYTLTISRDDGGMTVTAKEGSDTMLWYESLFVGDMPPPAAYEAARYTAWMALLSILHRMGEQGYWTPESEGGEAADERQGH